MTIQLGTTYQCGDAKDLPASGRQVDLDNASLPAAGVDGDSATKCAGNNLVAEAYADNGLGAIGKKVLHVIDERDDPGFTLKGSMLWVRAC